MYSQHYNKRPEDIEIVLKELILATHRGTRSMSLLLIIFNKCFELVVVKKCKYWDSLCFFLVPFLFNICLPKLREMVLRENSKHFATTSPLLLYRTYELQQFMLKNYSTETNTRVMITFVPF